MNTYATQKEFFDAFEAMTRSERMGLEVYANRCAQGTHYSDSMDIIHEAVARVLDGRRHWPRGVSVVVFLANCVKSLASASRGRYEARHCGLDALQSEENGERPLSHEPCESTEEVALRRERQRLSEAAIDFVRTLLADDFDGIRVLNGMVAELAPKEMREAFGLDAKDFAAARQRVMNRLRIWADRHPGY